MESVNNSSSSSWVVLDKVFVEQNGGIFDSEFQKVDLKLNRVVQKVGGVLWDRHPTGALAAVNNIIFLIGDIAESKYDYGDSGEIKYDYKGEYDLLYSSQWCPRLFP